MGASGYTPHMIRISLQGSEDHQEHVLVAGVSFPICHSPSWRGSLTAMDDERGNVRTHVVHVVVEKQDERGHGRVAHVDWLLRQERPRLQRGAPPLHGLLA